MNVQIEVTNTIWHEIFGGARRLRLLSNHIVKHGDLVTFTSGASDSRPYRITKHQPHLVGCYLEFVEAN